MHTMGHYVTLEKNEVELCRYETVTVGVVLHGKKPQNNIILCDLNLRFQKRIHSKL